MNEQAGTQFIHKKNSKLQLSKPVEHEQQRRKMAKLETSQKPAIRLSNWFEVLERTHLAHGASPERQAQHGKVMERIKEQYHKLFVIKPEAIPEEVFAREVRMAREQGHGIIPQNEELRAQKTAEIMAAQASSLDRWVDYLTSPDADAAGYPMWARYWAFMAITKMGKLEKIQHEDDRAEVRFSKRDEQTVAPFPELNPKALAQTFAAMRHHLEQQGLPKAERWVDNTSTVLGNEAYAQLLSDGSFAKIYAQFLAENPSITIERLKETRGEWVKYEHGSDATELFESLQGHTLEWCTAGDIQTAQDQLDGGDFYAYYSLDASGKPTVPRVAIRMEYDQIAEIRGIEHDQHLDAYIGEVLEGKLKDRQAFPNAKEYMQGVEDMKLVSAIERRMGARYDDINAEFLGYDNPNADLTIEELRFIYQIDRQIVSLGFGDDPRIEQIIGFRDRTGDLQRVFGTVNQTQIALRLLDADNLKTLSELLKDLDQADHNQIIRAFIGNNTDRKENRWRLSLLFSQGLKGLNFETAQALIDMHEGWIVSAGLHAFEGVDHNQIAQALIAAGEGSEVAYYLDKFVGVDHNQIAQALIAAGEGSEVARYIDNFKGVDHNQIAQALISKGQDRYVVKELHAFNGLDATVAQALIELGWGYRVAENLKKFVGVDYNHIAQALIDKGLGVAVAENLNDFEGIDHAQLAQTLIRAGLSRAVARNIHNFDQAYHNQIAQALLDDRIGDVVAKNLSRFQNLGPETLAEIEKYK